MSSPTNAIFTDPRDHPGRYVRRFAFHLIWILALTAIVANTAGAHETLTGVPLQTADTKLTHATDNLKNALSLNAVAAAQAKTDPTGEFSLSSWQQSQSAVVTSLQALHLTLTTRLVQEQHLNTEKKALQSQLDTMAQMTPKLPAATATASDLAANESALTSAANSGQIVTNTLTKLHRCSPGITGYLCRTF